MWLFALNMTWSLCEVYWCLDFEPSENQWRAANGIWGVRYLAWRLVLVLDTIAKQFYVTICKSNCLARFSRQCRMRGDLFNNLKTNMSLKRDYFNRKYIFQPLIFRGHVSFPGSIGEVGCCESRMALSGLLSFCLFIYDLTLSLTIYLPSRKTRKSSPTKSPDFKYFLCSPRTLGKIHFD